MEKELDPAEKFGISIVIQMFDGSRIRNQALL